MPKVGRKPLDLQVQQQAGLGSKMALNWQSNQGDSFLTSPRRAPNALLTEAPFGTSYTPQVRVRIVGGKAEMVADDPVPEQQHEYDTQYTSPRLQYLENDLTQRMERLEHKIYDGAPQQNLPSPRASRPERQPQYDLPLSQGMSPGGLNPHNPLNPHSVLPPISTDSVTGLATEYRLYDLLPRDKALTDRPITLSDAQTTLLYSALSDHLSPHQADKLKEVYLGLVSHDLRMTGFVPFEALRMVFHKHQVFFPLNLLRLLGSMYVSSSGMDMVQYEKILVFIGAALKNRRPKEGHNMPAYTYSEQPNSLRDMGPIPYERPAYYQYDQDNKADHISPRVTRRTPVRPDIGLHRMLEDQIVLSPRFDVERLRQNLMLADRTHRGTLSPHQIKAIVRSSGAELGDQLMDEVIGRCDDYAGQIKWDQFLEYIERVAPVRTGLHIPKSRRPLDHARALPTPRDSWPKQEGALAGGALNGAPMNEGSGGSQHQSPRSHGVEYQPPASDLSPRMAELNELGRRLEDRRRADSLEMKLRDLEDNYQKNKQGLLKLQRYGPSSMERTMSPANDGWFNRFVKLADALYKNDVDHSGALKPEEVRWLMGEYNDIYSLSIPLSVQENALQAARRSNGHVDINTLVNIIAKTKMKD